MGEFADRVFDAVRAIPRGKVSTYGQIARLIGSPRSARYVGFALRANPAPGIDPASIPCHRVVFKDGSLTDGYAFGGPDEQRRLLEAEDVLFADDTRVDMAACLWDGAGYVPTAERGEGPAAGANLPANAPTRPPDDFDWAAELGDD